jgi:putative transposase
MWLALSKVRVRFRLRGLSEERRKTSPVKTFGQEVFFVSTVGLDEEMVRNYIREQEREDERYEELSLWKS